MKKVVFALLFSIFAFQYTLGQTALRKKHYNLEKGVAIQGYDPVSYFTSKKAIEGNPKIQTSVEGATYFFSSIANKDLFLKESKKYEPQYGGWCAYAMGATNDKVEIDPETFKIVNGKLYLFFHNFINNTLPKWNKDEVHLKPTADKNWSVIFK